MRRRLTDGQVEEMRELYAAGAKQKALGARYGISQACVSWIVRGRGYADAPGPRTEGAHRKGQRKLSAALVRRIRERPGDVRLVARLLGVTTRHVHAIRRGAHRPSAELEAKREADGV